MEDEGMAQHEPELVLVNEASTELEPLLASAPAAASPGAHGIVELEDAGPEDPMPMPSGDPVRGGRTSLPSLIAGLVLAGAAVFAFTQFAALRRMAAEEAETNASASGDVALPPERPIDSTSSRF